MVQLGDCCNRTDSTIGHVQVKEEAWKSPQLGLVLRGIYIILHEQAMCIRAQR
jgi:hypothetical protein